jgi:hypothetical protein
MIPPRYPALRDFASAAELAVERRALVEPRDETFGGYLKFINDGYAVGVKPGISDKAAHFCRCRSAVI